MMLSSEDKCRLKSLIYDTVLWMCKDRLVPKIQGEFSVEGLIGVTLGSEDLMLVSINEQLNGGADGESCTSPHKSRKRRPSLTGDLNDSPSKFPRTTDGVSSPLSAVLNTLKSDIADKNTENYESASDIGLKIENTWENHQGHGEIFSESVDKHGEIGSESADEHGEIVSESVDNLRTSPWTIVQDIKSCITDIETQDELIEASLDSVIVIATKEVRARNQNPPNPSLVNDKTELTEADCLQVTEVVENRRNKQRYTTRSRTLHSREKTHACFLCEKAFARKPQLTRHLKSMHSHKPLVKPKIKTLKPFLCTECGKCFSTRQRLDYHSQVHTGERPHACSYCGRSFSQKHHLHRHMTIHTGEKNHQCLHCGKCFSVARSLQVHTRIHTGEKLYRCEICDRCFRCPSNYHKHRKYHREEQF